MPERHKSDLTAQQVIFIALGFGLGLVSLGYAFRWLVIPGSDRALLEYTYRNSEWLGLVLTAAAVMLGLAFGRLPERPFHGVPFEAAWWENVLFGLTPLLLAGSSFLLGVYGFIAIALVFPTKLIVEQVLGRTATLVSILVAFPFILFAVGLALAFLLAIVIASGKGWLKSDDGERLLTAKRDGGTGAGTSDLVKVYYFACLTLLGADFAEYKPGGYCRAVTVLGVLVGRVIEVAIIAAGINLVAGQLWPTK
jgi:hypothetical protein